MWPRRSLLLKTLSGLQKQKIICILSSVFFVWHLDRSSQLRRLRNGANVMRGFVLKPGQLFSYKNTYAARSPDDS